MKTRTTGFALLAGLLIAAASTAGPAAAQDQRYGTPSYPGWQTAWDRYDYDRAHVILGTVIRFAPYRLQVAQRNGNVETIDLKHGTVILPVGTTPMMNERVAIVGYYSNGTFIANRVVVRG